MKNQFLPLLLIFAVVFVAGCTTQTSTASSNAIVIKSFGPEITEIEPTEDISVSAVIENIGGAKATQVKPILLGLTDEWKFDPGREYDKIDAMLPPDPARNLQGDVEELVWFLSPPKPAKKVTLTYDMELRVFFNYQTFSENLLTVATREYIDSFPADQKQAERDKLGVKTSIPSSGPISVAVFARTIVLDKGTEKMTVTVDIQNVGGGKPDNDQVEIKIKSGDKNLAGDCSGIEGGKVRLAQGKSRQLRCSIDVRGISLKEDVPISIELSYTYWVSAVSSITVLGAEIT